MSIAGYFGGRRRKLRARAGDVLVRGEGPVVERALSVEQVRAMDGQKARLDGEMYARVEDYDPVLRSVCRLDREG
ncbi:MAG TPA: hypothetical protein VM120_23525 [Bryobacteraceae bacterium]|nr:hypothetical protein [Bryobacteraceae bacterium]